jgi:nucleotide sugar dehydrogenase
MADAGFMVTGVDVDTQRIQQLNKGQSYIHEIGLQDLLKEQINKNLFVTTQVPADGDVYIISVGTPVETSTDGTQKGPVLKYLESACAAIGAQLKRGNLVVLRSTVPIGTCRNFVKQQLEQHSGLTCGIDFHLSFAPERTAEGKALKELRSLPQIIGGFNNDSLEATAAIFRDLTPTIIKVESLEAAEMAKLINNTYRDYIFAYANQMAKVASQFNMNIHDIIRAANEGYPRDPVPYPSPGVGGPCLTKDPHIFASVADHYQLDKNLFLNGRSINESMHAHVAESVLNQLRLNHKDLKTARVVVCGLAFKGNPETGDIRNSSAIDIVQLLKAHIPVVYGYDMVADTQEMIDCGVVPVSIEDAFEKADAVLFLNNHKSFEKLNVFDMVRSMNQHPIVYDGWNLFRADDILSAKPCTYMGISFTRSSI